MIFIPFLYSSFSSPFSSVVFQRSLKIATILSDDS
jgi:hypothetical protein